MRRVLTVPAVMMLVETLRSMVGVSGSRPAGISGQSNLEGYLLSQKDINKATARWNALLLSQTDDEDMLMDSGSGHGMVMSDAEPGTVYHSPTQGFIEKNFKESCCRLGKLAAEKYHSCKAEFYIQKLKALKIRDRLHGSQNTYNDHISSWTLGHTLVRQYKRCAFQQNSEFRKCCYVSQANKRRKMRIGYTRYHKVRNVRRRLQ